MFLLIHNGTDESGSCGCIYIPLCFYLYYYIYATSGGWSKFTFHYVSTYTQIAGIVLTVKTEFTFHYVSTYTCILLLPCNHLLYLHSTMFLLILSSRTMRLIRDSFTFHYVSTYTLGICCRPIHHIKIYIPLCFYLYNLWNL